MREIGKAEEVRSVSSCKEDIKFAFLSINDVHEVSFGTNASIKSFQKSKLSGHVVSKIHKMAGKSLVLLFVYFLLILRPVFALRCMFHSKFNTISEAPLRFFDPALYVSRLPFRSTQLRMKGGDTSSSGNLAH